MKALNVAWLYSELMNTYGDKGNIISLKKRSEDRKIKFNLIELNLNFNPKELEGADIIFMGGAQDRQQQIVAKDLLPKSKYLKEQIEKGKPGLYVCGAFQFLGKYYKEADGTIIKCLDILDLYTDNPGMSKRLIGNIAIKSEFLKNRVIGFENHGGRTFLGNKVKSFGKVIKGFGNNGSDNYEGAVFMNTFCTYLHGPILPKNPEFADHLIKLALETKYKDKIELEELNDEMENSARAAIAKRLNLEV